MTKLKLCLPFEYNGEHNDDASEFNVMYDDKMDDADKIVALSEEYPGKQIVISFVNQPSIPFIKSMSRLCDARFVLEPRHMAMAKSLAKDGLKVMMPPSMPARNIVQLDEMVACGFSDIYVADDLWYRVEETHDFLKDKHVRLRCVLNRIPSTAMLASKDPRSPVFMPLQDFIDMVLAKYVDICEFDLGYPRNPDFASMDVLVRAWKNGWWNGDVREINGDVHIPFPCTTMLPELYMRRFFCGHRCTFGSPCDKCVQARDMAEELTKKNVRFSKKNS